MNRVRKRSARCGRPSPTWRHHRVGSVLLVVVVVVMILSLTAYKYLSSMQTEHMAAALGADRVVGRQRALSARDLLAVLLERSPSDRNAMGGLLDNPLLFGGRPQGLDALATMETRDATSTPWFGIIAYPLPHRTEALFQTPSLSAGSPNVSSVGAASGAAAIDGMPNNGVNASIRFGATNESSKLHLGQLLRWEEQYPGAARKALLALPKMRESTADAILDWIDADDDPRPNGMEYEFYAQLTRAVIPRNRAPSDLEELLLVRGVNAHGLFGDAVPSHPLSPLGGAGIAAGGTGIASRDVLSHATTARDFRNRMAVDQPIGETPLPWREYLTVYSAERNQSTTGEPRVDVNQDDLSKLHQQLLTVVPSEWANFIVLYRQHPPDRSEIDSVSAEQRGLSEITIDFGTPPSGKLESLLDLVGVELTWETDNDTSLRVLSPISFDAAATRNQLPTMFDKLTTVPDKRLVGRVNINLAPANVLRGIPNMNESMVQEILSSRERTHSASPEEPSLRIHPVWLLVEGIVETEAMRALLPFVTCGGDVYRGEFWGYVDERAPMFRCEAILDASSGTTQQVYYRELGATPELVREVTKPVAMGVMSQPDAVSANSLSTETNKPSTALSRPR